MATFKFGDAVQYQPLGSNWPLAENPQLAFVTLVAEADPNNPASVATYTITMLPVGADYVVSHDGITEGPDEKQILALGSMSNYQKAKKEAKDAADAAAAGTTPSAPPTSTPPPTTPPPTTQSASHSTSHSTRR